MAYAYDPNLDDEQNKTAQDASGSTSAPDTTATSGTGAAPAPKAAASTGSGGFTNIQNYIRANSGTDAGQAAGNSILNSSDTAMKGANQASGAVNALKVTGPNANNVDDEAFLKTAADPNHDHGMAPIILGSGQTGRQDAATTSSNNAKADTDRFNNIFSSYGTTPGGTYSGPTANDVQAAADGTASAISNAQSANNLLKGDNAAGRAQALKTQYGNNTQYSTGENNLDSLLLERNYGSQFDPKYQQQNTALTNQSNQLTADTAAKNKQITDTQAAYTDSANKWRDLLNGAQSGISQEQTNAVQQRADSDNAAAGDKAAADKLSASQAAGSKAMGAITNPSTIGRQQYPTAQTPAPLPIPGSSKQDSNKKRQINSSPY